MSEIYCNYSENQIIDACVVINCHILAAGIIGEIHSELLFLLLHNCQKLVQPAATSYCCEHIGVTLYIVCA